MLELILHKGSFFDKSTGTVGPTALASGGFDLGFFGLIPETELKAFPIIHELVRGYSSSINTDTATAQWAKVVYEGKVLIFPLVHTNYILFKSLKDLGMLHSSSYFDTPDWPSGENFRQNPIIKIGDDMFKVRTFDGTKGSDVFSTTITDSLKGSEVVKVFRGLFEDYNGVGGWIGTKLDKSLLKINQTLVADSTASSYAVNLTGNLGSTTFSKTANTAPWCPVLEYIPASELEKILIDINDFGYTTSVTTDQAFVSQDTSNLPIPVTELQSTPVSYPTLETETAVLQFISSIQSSPATELESISPEEILLPIHTDAWVGEPPSTVIVS